MKKVIAVLAAATFTLAFWGCAAAADTFSPMGKILSTDYSGERCVYKIEITNGETGDARVDYADASSEMVLTFEKLGGSLAKITSESTIKFTSTPPYADKAHDYGGLIDRISSELIFNGYNGDFNPVSVKKTVDLQTSREFDAVDKSFTAEFTYPEGKSAGQGKYKKPLGGEEKPFEIKYGKLKGAFDNEQMYYMASSFLSKETNPDLTTKLGYSKQHRVFNLADYLSYGTAGDNLTFSVTEQFPEYNGLTAVDKEKLGFAQVGVVFPKGRPLIMYYSLDNVIRLPGKIVNTPIRNYLFLGYAQETLLNNSVTLTSFTLKEYSAQKA